MKEYIMRYENEVLQLLPDKIQPLVRCKDCKNRKEEWWNCPCRDWTDDDFFCASGKRKDGDNDG